MKLDYGNITTEQKINIVTTMAEKIEDSKKPKQEEGIFQYVYDYNKGLSIRDMIMDGGLDFKVINDEPVYVFNEKSIEIFEEYYKGEFTQELVDETKLELRIN
ncbi:TPA: hypothetical protein PTV74_003195 [Clostridium botulinum]|nr:hypothetical protein [Clostridium botulinum]HDK7206350.1 hypothetical protein [Clostridium botulinum]HDK7210086.1 hypothetical protein [Clostridium botulinum]HDK7265535.1 hypothetical protein [Clostridium botulinum]HDK7269383.1 hypothetical protein [Clostridium botulinum]